MFTDQRENTIIDSDVANNTTLIQHKYYGHVNIPIEWHQNQVLPIFEQILGRPGTRIIFNLNLAVQKAPTGI